MPRLRESGLGARRAASDTNRTPYTKSCVDRRGGSRSTELEDACFRPRDTLNDTRLNQISICHFLLQHLWGKYEAYPSDVVQVVNLRREASVDTKKLLIH